MVTIKVEYAQTDHRTDWRVYEDDEPIEGGRYCANRYATFHGAQLGDRQVHGWADCPPIGKAGPWLRKWARAFVPDYPDYRGRGEHKINVRQVKELDD